jgi:2-C-methyl-D-erythritol 2,4-cyclodiphosphate synthase
MFRVGIGFDVHSFGGNNKLYMGGVEINEDLSLIAHSDGDVLLHSIIDAILGASGLGDIGELFPDTAEFTKNMRSTEILKIVVRKIKKNGFRIVNLDGIVICEKPKILPYREQIREKIAELLEINKTEVMIKGKTTEHLGFIGRKEGIATQAVVLLEKRSINDKY